MKRVFLTIAVILVLGTILVGLSGCGHTHEWEEASCEAPKTCKSCGETEGTALSHEWVEATCLEPKHCVRCGAVEGKKAEHIWSEATCTEPKTCTVCGETSGDPLGHSVTEWTTTKEATCSEEGKRTGTCQRCSKECEETIEKIPHTVGDWEVVVDYIFNPDGTVQAGREATVCTICGEETETREYTVELTLSQKNAVICAYDALSYFHCGASYMVNTVLVELNSFPVADAKLAVAHMDVDWDEQAVLFARENCDGASKAGLAQEMRWNGFNNDQIEYAMAEIGY